VKKNKLIKAVAYPKSKSGIHFDSPIVCLINKNDKDNIKEKYSPYEYILDFELLKWSELDNCNFAEKIVYKINIPKWILTFMYTIVLLAIGAWLNSLF